VFIKICGITNEDDALSAIAVGATALGFILVSGSKRQVSLETAKDIIKRLPKGFNTVGVFKNETKEKIVRSANSAGFKIVQIHGLNNMDDFEFISQRVGSVIWSLSQKEMNLVSSIPKGVDYVMLDSPEPGSGKIFDWSTAQTPKSKKFILAGGLTPENVYDAVEFIKPWGVDVATGVEDESATSNKKDVSKMRRFCENARLAFENIGDGHSDSSNENFYGETQNDGMNDAIIFDWAND
jgi:phosphoribosylanthranilate isomerase